MIRRSVLAAGVLSAALAMSSCSTFKRADTVAEANGVKLTRDQLLAIADGKTDGGSLRDGITKWITVAVLGGDVTGVKDSTDLSARRTAAIDALSAPFLATAEQHYAAGVDADKLCLEAFPIDPTKNTAEAVLADMSGGTKFVDALKKYSSDAGTVQSGGIVQDQNGNACSSIAAEIVAKLKSAGAAPGKPVSIDVVNSSNVTTTFIVELRPFAELTTTDKVQFVQSELSTEVKRRLDSTKVYVNPKYGRYDKATVSVVALEQS